MKITQIAFWFRDGSVSLDELNLRFFHLEVLLTRLMNALYRGRRVQFINLEFSTEATYSDYPLVPRDQPYCYKGHLKYYGVLDLVAFLGMKDAEQQKFVWHSACDQIAKIALASTNAELHNAVQIAEKTGEERELNADFEIFQDELLLYGNSYQASVCIVFEKDCMRSLLKLTQDGRTVYTRELEKSSLGFSFFLEMYRSVKVAKNIVIVNGDRQAGCFPMKVKIDPVDLSAGISTSVEPVITGAHPLRTMVATSEPVADAE